MLILVFDIFAVQNANTKELPIACAECKYKRVSCNCAMFTGIEQAKIAHDSVIGIGICTD